MQNKRKILNIKEEVEKLPDPNSLLGIPGIGDVGRSALEREGYTTGLDLIYGGSTIVKEITGMDREKAGEAIHFLRDRLELAGLISKKEVTATEENLVRQNVKYLSTGVEELNRILNGGIECGSLTEFYGHEGSGKTQTSHTLMVQAFKPVEDGGFNDGIDKFNVLYIDTENTFRPERIISILAGKGMIIQVPSKIQKKLREGGTLTKEETEEYQKIVQLQREEATQYTDYIIKYKAINAFNQWEKSRDLLKQVPERNIKLVVVDSGTALFRSEYIGRGNMKAKSDLLAPFLRNMKNVADLYKIPVVLINQIYNKPDESYGNDPDIPWGGHVWGHSVPTRVKLWKSGRKHKARIIKSPYLEGLDCEFSITGSGISDLE